jgi:hypothetical protein
VTEVHGTARIDVDGVIEGRVVAWDNEVNLFDEVLVDDVLTADITGVTSLDDVVVYNDMIIVWVVYYLYYQ